MRASDRIFALCGAREKSVARNFWRRIFGAPHADFRVRCAAAAGHIPAPEAAAKTAVARPPRTGSNGPPTRCAAHVAPLFRPSIFSGGDRDANAGRILDARIASAARRAADDRENAQCIDSLKENFLRVFFATPIRALPTDVAAMRTSPGSSHEVREAWRAAHFFGAASTRDRRAGQRRGGAERESMDAYTRRFSRAAQACRRSFRALDSGIGGTGFTPDSEPIIWCRKGIG